MGGGQVEVGERAAAGAAAGGSHASVGEGGCFGVCLRFWERLM